MHMKGGLWHVEASKRLVEDEVKWVQAELQQQKEKLEALERSMAQRLPELSMP